MSAPMHRVVGLMSGTSLDGIDAAFVETDGEQRVSTGPSLTLPYDDALRARLRAALGGKGAVAEVERALTEVHGEVVRALIAQHSIAGVDLVGFHGHTILHRPDQGRTWQLGDGGATLAAMAAAAGARAAAHFPLPARRWLVCGGGRRNPVLMAALASLVGKPIDPVEAVGWDGDALEAQAFAYLAVRSTLGLPLSLPGTTGVARPMTGGRLFFAPTDQSLPRRPSRA